MGNSSPSTVDYSNAAAQLKQSGQSFARSTTAAATGNYSNIADILNPRKLKNGLRESCFAKGFNDATPIIIAIDGTGSMGTVPGIIQDQLPKLIELLVEQGVSDHPNVMFMCFDDEHACPPDAVFQMSQFEIGAKELVTSLNEMIIPGNGGGNSGEAYHLPIYAAANHTKLECFDQNGQKGFFFLICDEEPYYYAGDPAQHGTSPAIAKEVFGDTLEKEVSMLDSLKKLAERYHVFCLRPEHTSHGKDNEIKKLWQKLFRDAGEDPERVINVGETDALISTMAMTIGRLAGIDRSQLVDVLKAKGAAGVDSADIATLAIRPSEALVSVGTASSALVEGEDSGRDRS